MTRLHFSRTQFTRCAAAAVLTFLATFTPIAAEAQPIAIPLGASVQAAINTNPAGTTFTLAAGTYTGQTQILPLNGDTFIGAGGVNSTTQTIFDGGGISKPFILSNDSVTDVKLQDFVVQHYFPLSDLSNDDAAIWAGQRWILTNICVDWCGVDGVNLYADAQMNGGEVKNCGHRGIGFHSPTGSTYNNSIVNNVEIAYNNTKYNVKDSNGNLVSPETGSLADAAGLKGGGVDGVVVSFCSVHDNHGVGIWADSGCHGWFIHDNSVKNNHQDGITYEISYNGSIYSNLVTYNGDGSGFSGQILIANSNNTNAYLDIVVAGRNQNAILLKSDGHRTPSLTNNGLNQNNVTFTDYNPNNVPINTNGGIYGLFAYNNDQRNLGTGNYSNYNNFHLTQGMPSLDFFWGVYGGGAFQNYQTYLQTGEDPSSTFSLY